MAGMVTCVSKLHLADTDIAYVTELASKTSIQFSKKSCYYKEIVSRTSLFMFFFSLQVFLCWLLQNIVSTSNPEHRIKCELNFLFPVFSSLFSQR